MSYQRITGPLMANSHPGSYSGQDAYSDMLVVNSSGGGGIAATLDASYYKGSGSRNGNEREFIVLRKERGIQSMPEERKYVIRRLTPLECCRLQGFPDYWEDGVEGSDSARYKMWGNGMALPCVCYVMQGIREVLSDEV